MSDKYDIEVTDELAKRVLPCPFCGARKVWMFGEHNSGMVYVACHGLDCYASNGGPDIDAAIDGWNRRSIFYGISDAWTVSLTEPILVDMLARRVASKMARQQGEG